jgi:phosphomannomutase
MDVLMVGISGMRGTIGGTLTPLVVGQYLSAFAAWLKQNEKPANGRFFRVVLGRDSRPSGSWVRDAAVSALTASGVEVTDLDVVSTPGVAMMVKHLDADAGVVITASHNPIQWNGVKFLNRRCVAPPPATAQQIIALYQQGVTAYANVQELQPPQKNPDTHALHVKRVLDYVDVKGIASRRYKVVLDSVNGAGCVSSMTLLSKLGCEVVHLNGKPDGQFAHEPEPTAANLTDLAQQVQRHQADIGFAQDPDADRLAIVDEKGIYIGEEYSLALAAKYMLAKKKGAAVLNLSSSRMLDDIAAASGSTVIRTAVGEANVVDAMFNSQAVIGGEGNGGVIDTRIVPGRDSLVGMAYVLQLMASSGKTLGELVAEIPRYEIVKTKFECRREDANRAVEALKKEFASEKVDTQDGIRIDWAKAWVHARPSNTEPIMRIIAEAPTRAEADEKVALVRTVVDRTLSK